AQCRLSDNPGSDYTLVSGGGILNAGVLIMTNVVVRDNLCATYYGGLYGGVGGGLCNLGTASLTACAVINNTASDASGANSVGGAGAGLFNGFTPSRVALPACTASR